MTYPAAEPFFFSGDPTGCLLLHGFVGTPAEMRGLGETLATRGHTVYGVRLAGHGGAPEELRSVHWHDWLYTAQDALHYLEGCCEQVVVVGFSLGGALALLLAQQHTFARLALIATPLSLQGDWRLRFLPVAHYVVPWFYPLEHADLNDPFVQARIREYDPNVDLSDPEVCAAIRQSVRIPVRAIDQLQRVLRRARAFVPRVQVPTLIMHGREDDIVAPANAKELLRRLGTPHKRLVWREQTGHQMLVVGPQREAIEREIADFVTEAP